MSSPEVCKVKRISTRTVDIQIHNHSKSKTLTDAATFNYSGHVYVPPPPLISPGEKGEATFVKARAVARGSVGLLTYQFGSSQFTILFSNPFDYNLYSIEFALYIGNASEQTDKFLYRKMYRQLKPQKNYAREKLNRRSHAITVSGGGLNISATMSNEAHSTVKIDIRDA